MYRRRSFGYRGTGGSRPAPVELGKEYEAEIVEMSRRGDAGVARIQGFVVFVSNARPGQRAKFVITKVGGRYATAELVKGKSEETEEEQEEE